MDTGPIIELANVSVSRGPPASASLSGVNWQVAAGDFWVLAGPHGAGKTALFETVAGLLPCAAGELRLFGKAVGRDQIRQPELRRRVGLVFEGGGRVFSRLTVAENIALPVCYHTDCPVPEAVEQTASLREALGLERLAVAPAGRIGRAWAQRVALGRALALQPEVLLLDNPIAGMDPSHVRWWRTFLGKLAAGHAVTGGRPLTLLVAAEDLRPWLQAGRQFALVQDRRWVPLGGAAEIAASTEAGLREWLQPD